MNKFLLIISLGVFSQVVFASQQVQFVHGKISSQTCDKKVCSATIVIDKDKNVNETLKANAGFTNIIQDTAINEREILAYVDAQKNIVMMYHYFWGDYAILNTDKQAVISRVVDTNEIDKIGENSIYIKRMSGSIEKVVEVAIPNELKSDWTRSMKNLYGVVLDFKGRMVGFLLEDTTGFFLP